MALTPETSDSSTSLLSRCYIQEPIAIVGMSCRLPGQNDSPHRLWEFLMKGGVADTEAPETRFNRKGHYDGSDRPRTSRSSGAMFMETVDPAAFDAKFFNITPQDAISMDPQQRILLEVVYEALENAGISLESISGEKYGCYVGAHPGDYWDIFARDPDARPSNVGIGCSGTMLSCRVSHFLNIKGPSMPIDTACSSSLVAMDVACRALHTGEINGAIVAASSLILNPEYACEGGTIRYTHSPTGRCHVFDAKADGYVRAEGMNTVILKRLDDALQNGDPIRAVIRGIANNHNGRTPGIASPSGDDQAAAVRQAYANANITDFSHIGYLECHGTGTLVGDPIETEGASLVFAPYRPDDQPLRIGSIKSNIGHSEPAAGLSGILKAVMVLETGKIPGNPTFLTPNPNIDFKKLKLEASRHVTDFPDMPFRRVGVNCFGFGGSNAHAILEEPSVVLQGYKPTYTSSFHKSSGNEDEATTNRPYLLCFSANDEASVRRYIQNMTEHMQDEKVKIKLRDLAYTLGTRRSHLFNRAYMVADSPNFSQPTLVTFGKKSARPPQVGFLFTGQGSQWPEMGRELLQAFEPAREMIRNLDSVLHCLPDPPKWTLYEELTTAQDAEHVRKPEFSQPLVTALQLALIAVLRGWGIVPNTVVGHSSGEIAAAYTAGYLTEAEAIIIAYHRGKASADEKPGGDALGMLAVGIGAGEIVPFMDGCENVQIACYNSPKSLTLSGNKAGLEEVRSRLVEAGVFARMLQVDMAYHSAYMESVGAAYERLLARDLPPTFHGNRAFDSVSMFSSVYGSKQEQAPDVHYWKTNMTCPVRFDDAVRCMLSEESPIDKLIEIGPSGTLKGPIAQIMASMGSRATATTYLSALKRGQDSIRATLEVAGELYLSGLPVDMAQVNEDVESSAPRVIIDLPNYCWNHSTRYWNESAASRDWRFKRFVQHDLIGSKVLGASWRAPLFKKTMNLTNLPWLKDHRIGSNVVFPGSGYLAMAIEGIYQLQSMNGLSSAETASDLCYHLRNVRFEMALTLEEGIEPDVYLSLNPLPGSKDVWYEFSVSSSHAGGATIKHAGGQIRVQDHILDVASTRDLAPLVNPVAGDLWTKAFAEMGFEYGPAFYLLEKVEAHAGKRYSRSLVTLCEPSVAGKAQSHYPYHPAALDGIFRATAPAFCEGLRTRLKEPLVPSAFDDLIINPNPNRPASGMAVATSAYSGRGRENTGKSFWSDVSMYDPDTGALLMQLKNFSTHLIDLGVDPIASQWLTRDVWKPDITTLMCDALSKLNVPQEESVPYLLDLMAHRNPALAILEINLGTGAETSTWFERKASTATESYRRYCCLGEDIEALDRLQARYRERKNASFFVYDREGAALGLDSTEETFDAIIVNFGTDQEVAPLLRKAKGLLSADGRVLLTGLNAQGAGDQSSQIDEVSFSQVLPIPEIDSLAYLCGLYPAAKNGGTSKTLHLFYMEPSTSLTQAIRAHLHAAGWEAIEHVCNPDNIPESSTVLVIDELFAPVLPQISDEQWQCLRGLVGRGCKILWVTHGGQMQVTEPDNAMISGLFRSIRSEDPSAVVMTLDVESRDDPFAPSAIVHALAQLSRPQARWLTDCEYAERNGIIYIHRVEPYKRLDKAIEEETDTPILTRIHDLDSTVQLRAERLGTLDGLTFCEIAEVALPDHDVEIEVQAVGLNFKDVAVTMGIVPENEYLLGLEGAGIVRRVGAGLSPDLVGSRMAFIIKGSLANRVQVPIGYTHEIPASMSFEEAASMSVVYSTAIYSLFNIGNLQKGQRVLIHSAAGGVGIACIQLALYAEAEIFVTVGTDEKRQYLHETFGIPFDRMFTSRSTAFAAEIMKATNGEGIDVIVNSLTGELLDATWRICADGGTMVEIGKRDIVERNYLSMEPFDRGCSYRAVDLSHAKIMRDGVHFKLMKRIFELTAGGHISPITRITPFSMTQIPEAFAYLRSGKHIGKIVISDGEATGDIAVPVRRLQHKVTITDTTAFLIVGGLKGLCGSFAIRLAYRGVRHIVIMTRSGCRDPRSQAVIAQCRSLGCEIYDCRGDVARIVDVRRAFTRAPYPIQGVIHGAMVLRDRPYETMTVREFHQATEAKVHGAWNLHSVATEKRLPLGFFLCLSSISSVVGSKGQANYAAANSFLDSFAAYRRSLGAQCLTVNLGVIEDVGVIAESDALSQRYQRSIETTAIPESALHAILDAALCCQVATTTTTTTTTTDPSIPPITQMITGLALPQDPEQSMLRFDPRFRTLFAVNSESSSAAGGSGSKTDPLARAVQQFQRLFPVDKNTDPDEQLVQQTCLEILGTRLAQMLRWDDSQQVEPGQPLSVYGLDSLAAVELRNWIKAEMGANVSTLDIVNADSLVMLGGRVVAKLRAEREKGVDR